MLFLGDYLSKNKVHFHFISKSFQVSVVLGSLNRFHVCKIIGSIIEGYLKIIMKFLENWRRNAPRGNFISSNFLVYICVSDLFFVPSSIVFDMAQSERPLSTVKWTIPCLSTLQNNIFSLLWSLFYIYFFYYMAFRPHALYIWHRKSFVKKRKFIIFLS